MRIVLVKWRDSNYHFDQHTVEKAKAFRVAIFETVGHVVSEDSDRLVLAGDWLPLDDEVRHVMAIPVENIISRTVLVG